MNTRDFATICRNMGRDPMAELARVEGGVAVEPRPAKYRNRKKEIDGHTFDSCKEAKVYLSLKYRQQGGEITDLALQPRYLLQEAFRDAAGLHRRIEYVADFAYRQDGRLVVVEAKGCETAVWRLKEKLFRAKFPNIRLEIWR